MGIARLQISLIVKSESVIDSLFIIFLSLFGVHPTRRMRTCRNYTLYSSTPAARFRPKFGFKVAYRPKPLVRIIDRAKDLPKKAVCGSGYFGDVGFGVGMVYFQRHFISSNFCRQSIFNIGIYFSSNMNQFQHRWLGMRNAYFRHSNFP